MTTERALNAFWSSFGISAYPSGRVPTGETEGVPAAKMPYITYDVIEPEFGDHAMHRARLWYRSESFEEIAKKKDEILGRIGYGGVMLEAGKGAVCLRYGASPLVQYLQSDEEPDIISCFLNLQIDVYHMTGE